MTISVIYPVLLIQLFLDYELILENKILFLETNYYFLIIQDIVDRKVHFDDTICKDFYNYCHLLSYLGDTMYDVTLNIVFSVTRSVVTRTWPNLMLCT
jgi:hypothetical protein